MQHQALARALISLLVAAALLVSAAACGSSGGRVVPAWDRDIQVKGRSRSLLSFHGRRCGTRSVNSTETDKLMRQMAYFKAMESANVADVPTVGGVRIYSIPTYVTIVIMDDGTGMGDVKDAAVKAQLARLNTAYATSSQRSGIRWFFDVKSIKRVVGLDMCDTTNEGKMKTKHRQGDKGDLNLFITDLSACGLLGFSTWPWDINKGTKLDGVVIHYDTLPVQGRYAPYNMGVTAVHEIGHWMGLFHTFQNGCTKGGDLVDDTPYSASPTEGCPTSRKSCPQVGNDPIHNFMDYTDDKCMREFSPLQHQRMEMVWAKYRTPLAKVAMTKAPKV